MMENLAKVSIIIPVYNVEKYLRQALDSVINQTLKEIEIICVNDGSTDNSLLILQEYQAKDDRIKIIVKQNGGYGKAMNDGIKIATGEYIGIVEPDDYVEKDMFEVLYQNAKQNDYDVVKSNLYEFDDKKEKYIYGDNSHTLYNKKLDRNNKRIFFFRMNTWTGIYKREFLLENNIWHNETPGASFQDNGFWFQTLAFANSVVFINKAFYHYRTDNPNSSINNSSKIYCMCDEFDYIEQKLKEKHFFDELKDIFFVKKFHNYIYNYFRVGEKYKLEFLQKFASDFKGVDLTLLKPYATKKQIESIIQITNSPQLFNDFYKNKTLDDYNKAISSTIFEKIIKFIKHRLN